MDWYVSPKDEIWFLRVCHHISNAVYKLQALLLYTDRKRWALGVLERKLYQNVLWVCEHILDGSASDLVVSNKQRRGKYVGNSTFSSFGTNAFTMGTSNWSCATKSCASTRITGRVLLSRELYTLLHVSARRSHLQGRYDRLGTSPQHVVPYTHTTDSKLRCQTPTEHTTNISEPLRTISVKYTSVLLDDGSHTIRNMSDWFSILCLLKNVIQHRY